VQSTFFIKRRENKVIQDSTSYTKRVNKKKKKKSATEDPKPNADETSNREEACACASLGLVEDCQREGHRHQGLPIVDAPVALPPNQPSD
jgi:hypothetical protein